MRTWIELIHFESELDSNLTPTGSDSSNFANRGVYLRKDVTCGL
jgi:hypothetical protein